MDDVMTTTTFTLEGYRIVESLGVVRGVTVRSRSLLGTIGAKVETCSAATSPCLPRSASAREPTRSRSCSPMRAARRQRDRRDPV